MGNRAPISQEKLKARKRKKLFWMIVASFSGAVILVSALSFVLFLDFFQIKDIEVSGATKAEVDAAAVEVERSEGGVFLGFFPRTSIFFVSPKDIAQHIKDAFPSVASVSVSKKFFSTIIVTMEEKQAAALWCLGGSCADVDESGVAFEKSASATTSLVVFETGTMPEIGASPLSSDKFIPLLLFIANLPQRGIYASTVTINDTGADDIAISTSTDIVIDPTKDLTKALSNLDQILSDKTSGITLDTIDNLKYIDLRFPDKVFYK